jgi:RecA-family ATPase
MSASIPNADIGAAVEHLMWIARHQSEGFSKLTVLKTSSDDHSSVREQKWLHNRDPELATKLERYLQKWKGKLVTVLYSVSSFADREAKAENANPSKLVHVDFDKSILPKGMIAPTRAVKSSERGMHLFWVLQRELSPSEIQSINKSLTYTHGGDKGGHSTAKQLRLVGFPNLKYSPPQLVRLGSTTKSVYEPEELSGINGLDAIRDAETDLSDVVVVEAAEIDPKSIQKKYWHKLDVGTRLRLRQSQPYQARTLRVGGNWLECPRDDRSEVNWGIGIDFRRNGASAVETLAVVMDSPFWKEREQEGKAEYPLRFIQRIFSADIDELPKAANEDIKSELAIDPAVWDQLPVPIREWIIENWIPLLKVMLIYGDGGIGKTLIVLMLAIACVMDRKFIGLPVKSGKVYAFLAENDEIDTRISLDDICSHYGVGLQDLSGKLRIASRAGFDNVLMSFKNGDGKHMKLFHQMLGEIVAFGPVLVILETAADLFDGNENARNEVRRFMSECCLRIAMEVRAAVVVCAHPSMTGLKSGDGSSGSTAWSNSSRSRIFFRRDIDDNGNEIDPDVRILEVKKGNFTKVGHRVDLVWKDGVFIVDDPVANRHASRQVERKLIAEIERAFAAGNPWSAHHQGGLRYIVKWMTGNLKLSHRLSISMLQRLMGEGQIVELAFDKHTHKRGLASAEQGAKQQRNKEAN